MEPTVTLIDLAVFVFLCGLSLLAGSFAYESTDNMLFGVLAGLLGMFAIPGLLLGACWISERTNRHNTHNASEPGENAGPAEGTPEGAALDRRGRWNAFLVFTFLAVLGQLIYAGTRDRMWALFGMAWALCVIHTALACRYRKRSAKH